MKRYSGKKRGSAQIFVIAALVLISVFSAFVIRVLQADTYQIHAYSLQMQAYYLANEAASASVSALLADDDESLLETGTFPMHDRMVHKNDGKEIGTSDINMCIEKHNYYNEEKEWVVIRIETNIPDNRAARRGEAFGYEMTVMVLRENPIVRLYNINPDEI